MNKELYELSQEIKSISNIVLGLTIMLDNKNGDYLTRESLSSALNGVSNHLDRIAEDIEVFDK
ncbi:MAG: hypothetical protein IJZ44_02105 [Lachnospiraceae bacterium]|nr:hypothetical protein [Lachnospiraceae bacterium]